MAQKAQDFEGGAHASSVTTGESSPDAFSRMDAFTGNTFVYDNTRAAHGSLAAKVDSSSSPSSDCVGVWVTTLGATHYFRLYLNMEALPAAEYRLYKVLDAAESALYLTLSVLSDGKVRIRDPFFNWSYTSTATLAADTWYRIEGKIVEGASTGQVEFKIFTSIDSPTPAETVTSPASIDTGTGHGCAQVGLGNGGSSGQVWLDDVVAGAASYPGPASGGGPPVVIPRGMLLGVG